MGNTDITMENTDIAVENTDVTDITNINIEDFILYFECEFCDEKFDDDRKYRRHLEKHIKPFEKKERFIALNLYNIRIVTFIFKYFPRLFLG